MSDPKAPQRGGDSTRAVHGGEREGRPRVSDALSTPIVQTSTFWFRDTQELIDYQEGRHPSYEYGRYGNPTTQAAADKLRELEGGEACVLDLWPSEAEAPAQSEAGERARERERG